VSEMRKQQEEQQAGMLCAADPDEAAKAYQQALENSMAAPAAAHPVESYGTEGNSLAGARRKVCQMVPPCTLRKGRQRCTRIHDGWIMSARAQGYAVPITSFHAGV
jgi:hypothetical protein